MPLTLGWTALAARLLLTLVAGGLIGLNRGEHGRAVGLRTTMLVCLASSIAMLQANLLLPTAGKPANSFVTLDLMRLPLGILSGMGFIGAGAIIQRSGLVVGVTTAATLWIATVIGLCFGGGQYILGAAATGLTLGVLVSLRWAEKRMPREQRATLLLTVDLDTLSDDEVRAQIGRAGFHIVRQSVTYAGDARTWETLYAVTWRSRRGLAPPPDFLPQLAGRSGVRKLQWTPAEQN